MNRVDRSDCEVILDFEDTKGVNGVGFGGMFGSVCVAQGREVPELDVVEGFWFLKGILQWWMCEDIRD